MKKKLFFTAALFLGLAFAATSCSDDNESINVDPIDIDYTSDNAASWQNYMRQVAALLKNDAASLYSSWAISNDGGASFAQTFKTHNGGDYPSTMSCIQEIIEGCANIANEVGTQKIGEPYNLYSQSVTEALYAVESWYSWHSRDDYRNNIYSIRNSYYGSLDGSVSSQSISALVKSVNADLDAQVVNAINAAANAIYNIPQPFRNNINSNESVAAMTACAELENVLSNTLLPYIASNLSENSALQGIIDNYVDVVILPTYLSLQEKNVTLYNAVVAFCNNPSNTAFETACDAWLEAREPWEKSEAFLFGPVDAKGLDPNMDSWPLDQTAIVNILNSGNYDDLDWSDGDSDDKITARQEVRGFHTLEFLLFKNGVARRVN